MTTAITITITFALIALGFNVAHFFIYAYTKWVYDKQIPATRTGQPEPPMPWSARVGKGLVR